MTRGRHGLRGIWVACLALVMVVAVSIGFAAVTVLVVALDSGGSVDPVNAAVLGWVFFLISQGVKVTLFGVLLGVPPLLLTIFDVACIAALVRRRSPHVRSFIFGVATWVAVVLLVSSYSGLKLSDSLVWCGVKAFAVFTLGYAIGSYESLTELFLSKWGESLRPSLKIVTRESLRVTKWLFTILAVLSLIVVALWLLVNRDAMGKVFEMTHMPIGSRIITTILSFFWLPNLCLWTLSWLFGSGFSIGSLGSFTLWSGTAHDLPPVPIFGIFPSSVSSDSARFVFLLIPVAIGVVVGVAELVSKRGYNFFDLSGPGIAENAVLKKIQHFGGAGRRKKNKETPRVRTVSNRESSGNADAPRSIVESSDTSESVEELPNSSEVLRQTQHDSHVASLLHLLVTKGAYPIASFCMSSVLLVFFSAACFVSSNGSLGTGNLKKIGVDVAASTQSVARPIFSGLLIAWVLVLVVLCIRQVISVHKRAEMPSTSLKEDDLVPLDEINVSENRRVAASSSLSSSQPQDS